MTESERLINMLDSGFHRDQIRALTILARLPIGFFPKDCLVIDEITSPMLYQATTCLLSNIPIFVVTHDSDSIKSEKGSLGYITASSLRRVIELRKKAKDLLHSTNDIESYHEKFQLIVFIAKAIMPVLPVIAKVINARLPQSGVVIIVTEETGSSIDRISTAFSGFRLLPRPQLMDLLLPSKETIIVLTNQTITPSR